MKKCNSDTGKGCAFGRIIVNRKHDLCQECNHIRLHGCTQQEKWNKNKKPKQYKPVKKVSNKQSKENNQLIKVYKEMAENTPHFCTGCGTTQNLTHSHIIPRSYRKDLVCDPKNITYHCIDCHSKWEGKERVQLLDYESNMEYIKSVDLEYYHRIKNKEQKN